MELNTGISHREKASQVPGREPARTSTTLWGPSLDPSREVVVASLVRRAAEAFPGATEVPLWRAAGRPDGAREFPAAGPAEWVRTSCWG